MQGQKSASLMSSGDFLTREQIVNCNCLFCQLPSWRVFILRCDGLFSPLPALRSPSSRSAMAPPAACLPGKHTAHPQLKDSQIRCSFLVKFKSMCLINPVTKLENRQRCRAQPITESTPPSQTLPCCPVTCTFRGHHLLCLWPPRLAGRQVDAD